MKRKIICMSIIGLLLLTGVASFSGVAKPIEQNTPVVKSEGDQYKTLKVFGGAFYLHVLIIFEEPKHYEIKVYRNGDYTGGIEQGHSIFEHRFNYNLLSQYYPGPNDPIKGELKVEIIIDSQTYTYTGQYNRCFCWGFTEQTP